MPEPRSLDPHHAAQAAAPCTIHNWSFAADGRCLRANGAHAACFGHPVGGLAGRSPEELYPPALVRVLREALLQTWTDGEEQGRELLLPAEDGQARRLALILRPEIVAQQLVALHATALETPLPDAMEDPRSEINHRAFLEAIDDIAVVGDSQGLIRYANPAAIAKLGWSMADLAGKPILDLHPKWARTEAQTILQDMFAGRRRTCPLPLEARDGTLLPVETRVWVGQWNGEPSVFGLSKDLSKEQEALQTFDRLFRMNPAPMALTGYADRRFVDVNDAWLRILGYRRDEVLGRSTEDLGLFPDSEQQRRAGEHLRAHGAIHEIELQVCTKRGELREGLFSGEVIRSQGESYFLTVMLDITERKRAEAERRRTIEELQAALEKIRVLEGFIPICSVCRKLRLDESCWGQLEEYLTKHTDSQLSHGLCPDCARDHFGLS
jgi:PAS domain S-box-containing protein